MCRASSTIRGPFIRGIRQRLSAVPATARSMSSKVSAWPIVASAHLPSTALALTSSGVGERSGMRLAWISS